jgi:glycosyltransferase involved in cell wall biosynthesis
MPRVLHVIPTVAPRYGGPSTAIWPMTEALHKGGVEVEIATTDADGAGRISRDRLPQTPVPVHLFAGPGDLALWLNQHALTYDMIHSHSLWNPHSAAACRAARARGIPYIVRPCGMLSDYTWRRGRWKKRAYWWAVERRNVLSAAGLHATSAPERQDILRCGVTAPVEVIPLGIEPSAFATPARPHWLRERCQGAAGDRPIVLYLSRLHPKKGLTDLLLPAFADLQTAAHLAIAGGVDDSTPDFGIKVNRSIDQLRLRDRVSVLGPISAADCWAAYDGAAVFCLPSHSENFGLVVIEAMARGAPVVLTEGVQIADHLTASRGGIVVAPNIRDLAAALDTCLADPKTRSDLGQAGREYCRQTFDWAAIGRDIGRFYRRTLR